MKNSSDNQNQQQESPQIDIEKVKLAFNAIAPACIPIKNDNWSILFDFYNSKNQKKISMGCFPCYRKVYFFTRDYLQTLPQ